MEGLSGQELGFTTGGGELVRIHVRQAARLGLATRQKIRRAMGTGGLRFVRVGRQRTPMTTPKWIREWAESEGGRGWRKQ